MAKGVVSVRRFFRNFKAQQADDGAARVGEVVHRVGHNGDTSRQGAHRQFGGEEQNIGSDAHRAGEGAVAGSNPGIPHLFAVPHKGLDQQRGHITAPFLKNCRRKAGGWVPGSLGALWCR